MNVYTYFTPVPGMDPAHHLALIDIWAESWRQHGWNPVVLNEADARKHPKYAECKRNFWQLPSVNGNDYEGACFMRWPAVAAAGGGVMADYDVLNYGFRPPTGPGERLPDVATVFSRVVYWAVPCVVAGTAAAFDRVVDTFLGWQPDEKDVMFGRPHVSDQTCVTRLQHTHPDVIQLRYECQEYLRNDEDRGVNTDPGYTQLPPLTKSRNWYEASLVHYPTGVMSPKGQSPKHLHVKKALPFLPILTRAEFPALLNSRGLTGRGVEIGVAHGEFSEIIAANWYGHLCSIDPWRKFGKDEYKDCINDGNLEAMAQCAISRLRPYKNCTVIRATSLEAVGQFPDGSLDFVYIDANHEFRHAMADLEAWWPKVRSGGFFSGHDYYNATTDWLVCGVKDAVDAFCKAKGLTVTPYNCSSWSIWKP